ncbi:protein COFACTOR ASSEMBLY OF COMPLEX C SUBUNIT B CCB2, chloroplastic isoform X1 [Cucurbita maxima]|uniref:Protein COFACTOR ASSEMBLY OF COMPLEX C SUBUNIT B CCB2, chloroplastic isoform X1 n=1 Tax=Cucurbita maxima TaxID=3661 RepID=A0A6J1HXW3_CUCMA|nr:protein COFACTOR ASSEMBLY OF COMPLEX C SUBUNIT B CCB2, chloroplastic isoform X1 [Cucurbita maxima]XP_022968387.1 protein COFACTOR ASSEMBLY OF COMPLEX C SUBUNIT B CCB2, chloroplastic isoform X1 [Cucurbita maxima]XP_022968388.1 protein COFACTOR ASSEMBLY OF COMPLEX C SUBUNIT B CCB2, chloroplastic isoform X1 [Cucurbita maxima]XP_022968389.1 protein COFACTOR ASSEMBLY OF COMPLEX C SUBUNIT B CCB2, chloroplastic isoform X1 [Cucurbita maxima]XP_022968390.1 protein COFACTOR ASSEMBLY OF COMPLEX C SUBUN
MSCTILSPDPLIRLSSTPRFRAKNGSKSPVITARLDDSKNSPNRQLNLSVLRFTLGIPGLDESYLPRWIGYGFGSLLLLNHFVGSSSAAPITSAQLRTEALGISLAAFSIALPYLGKFLEGAVPSGEATLPEGAEQIFVLSQNVSDNVKDDLAWATYILLRNTNSISVLILIQGELCVRGYWNSPNDISGADLLAWFEEQLQSIGLSALNDSLYFPQISESGLWQMLSKGTRSVLVQPVAQNLNQSGNEMEKIGGFILVASSLSYAFSDKDRAWIRALATKFDNGDISWGINAWNKVWSILHLFGTC